MPWWSWLVIWGALVLLTLALLAWLGYRIVIKLLATLRAVGELADKAELLDARAHDLASEHAISSVFANPADIAFERRAQQADRRVRRQRNREARVRRGKLLVSADPRQYSHLLKRT